MNPRIRIYTKMSWIWKTGTICSSSIPCLLFSLPRSRVDNSLSKRGSCDNWFFCNSCEDIQYLLTRYLESSIHRVPTPPPFPLREGRQVEIIWTRNYPPFPHWDRRATQWNHIKFRTNSAHAPMWSPPPCKRKCWTKSGGPLVNSVLCGSIQSAMKADSR